MEEFNDALYGVEFQFFYGIVCVKCNTKGNLLAAGMRLIVA
jgi:hypothetical protein